MSGQHTLIDTRAPASYTREDWRRIAGTRQGVINKLDKRVKRLEALVELLTKAES